jgi:hypothetical protein
MPECFQVKIYREKFLRIQGVSLVRAGKSVDAEGFAIGD